MWFDSLDVTDILLPLAVFSTMLCGLLLIRLFRRRRAQLPPIVYVPQDVMKFSPAEYEYEIAAVLESLYPQVRAEVAETGRRGVDLWLYDKAGRLRGIAQARWVDPDGIIDIDPVQDIYQQKRETGAARAFLFATATFSENAIVLAQQLGVDLVDRKRFEAMRRRYYAHLNRQRV